MPYCGLRLTPKTPRWYEVLTQAGVLNGALIATATKTQTVGLSGRDVAAGLLGELAVEVIALDDLTEPTDVNIEDR